MTFLHPYSKLFQSHVRTVAPFFWAVKNSTQRNWQGMAHCLCILVCMGTSVSSLTDFFRESSVCPFLADLELLSLVNDDLTSFFKI